MRDIVCHRFDRLLLFVFVLGASLRVAWYWKRLPLDEAVKALRSVAPLPRRLRRAHVLQEFVNGLYRYLPPRGMRSCLKRSLLLLDLWARCGLQPEFHLGLRRVDGEPEGHAWVEVEGLAEPSTASGYSDALVV